MSSMSVPFCLPLIDQSVIDEVNDTLINTGWLTTGPKTKQFEKELASYCGVQKVLAVNSWNSGTQLMLKWYGIKQGDEVIIPAYTYSATALAAINLGAKVIMVDVDDDFNIDVEKIEAAITTKTKVIMPVDIGGKPCDYHKINQLVEMTQHRFMPEHPNQEQLGRILVMADAAHSIGAEYKGERSGSLCDISVFSFHSVKNITTGEGGAVTLNLPMPFDNEEVYNYLKHLHLYGQTKSALDKNKTGKWRYDIVSPGMKANMNDVSASIGLSQLRRYPSDLLPHRKEIFTTYNEAFNKNAWAITPQLSGENYTGSAHLYMLRIADISEAQRDKILDYLAEYKVGFSVHYIPMAMMTYFKSVGYKIEDYPNTYRLYASEISLPIYNTLKSEQQDYVINKMRDAYNNL